MQAPSAHQAGIALAVVAMVTVLLPGLQHPVRCLQEPASLAGWQAESSESGCLSLFPLGTQHCTWYPGALGNKLPL